MQKAIAIIPARLASKRLPKKVLREIAGKSLLKRTYDRVTLCDAIQEVVIATDHPEIEQHALDFGAKVVMTCPSHTTGTQRVAEAVEIIGSSADIVINVQADEPCFDPEIATLLIEQMASDPTIEVTTPISKIVKPEQIFEPSIVKCVFDQSGRALYFSRAPIPYPQNPQEVREYYRHHGVYCFKKEALIAYTKLTATPYSETEELEQLKWLEHGRQMHVKVVHSEAIGVDTPEDLKKVEAMLCQKTEATSL